MPNTKRAIKVRKAVRSERARLREAQASGQGVGRAQQDFLRATFLAKKGRLPPKV
jgi:hypothetical protein